MTEHKMWAVVVSGGTSKMYGAPVLAVETTKRGAKNTALAFYEAATWKYAKRHLGWRVRPCTVVVDEEGER